VGFVITNYFAVSDLSVFWDVCEFDKETCVGSRNVVNALKRRPTSLPKPRFQSGCRRGSFIRAMYYIPPPGDGVNDCIGLVLMVPMVVYQGDGHVGSVHAAKVVLGQVSGGNFL
jgi:hypothetical protein